MTILKKSNKTNKRMSISKLTNKIDIFYRCIIDVNLYIYINKICISKKIEISK